MIAIKLRNLIKTLKNLNSTMWFNKKKSFKIHGTHPLIPKTQFN